VPAGFTEDGLPVGLEFVTWDFREKALLEIAKKMEELVGARRAPSRTVVDGKRVWQDT